MECEFITEDHSKCKEAEGFILSTDGQRQVPACLACAKIALVEGEYQRGWLPFKLIIKG